MYILDKYIETFWNKNYYYFIGRFVEKSCWALKNMIKKYMLGKLLLFIWKKILSQRYKIFFWFSPRHLSLLVDEHKSYVVQPVWFRQTDSIYHRFWRLTRFQRIDFTIQLEVVNFGLTLPDYLGEKSKGKTLLVNEIFFTLAILHCHSTHY